MKRITLFALLCAQLTFSQITEYKEDIVRSEHTLVDNLWFDECFFILHTDFNVVRYPQIFRIIESVRGVSRADVSFKYAISVRIGGFFDVATVSKEVQKKVDEYANVCVIYK